MGTSVEAPPDSSPEVGFGTNDQLQNIIMTTRDLPAMPQVASKVLELSSDPNTSAAQLQQILQVRNIIIPGGSVNVGPERIVLEPSGNFDSVEDLRRTVIRPPGRSEVVYLGDVADISTGRALNTINRRDTRRLATITAEVDDQVTTPMEVTRRIEHEFAVGREPRAGDEAQQGGLPGPIGSDEAGPT